jgi:hypothetical protein
MIDITVGMCALLSDRQLRFVFEDLAKYVGCVPHGRGDHLRCCEGRACSQRMNELSSRIWRAARLKKEGVLDLSLAERFQRRWAKSTFVRRSVASVRRQPRSGS